METLVYDLETQHLANDIEGGWKNIFGMSIGSCVIYSLDKDRYYFFLHNSSREKILKILSGNKVVTHNGYKFDSVLLLGNKRQLAPSPSGLSLSVTMGEISWGEFDILNQCHRLVLNLPTAMEAFDNHGSGNFKGGGLSLDKLCKATLGISKSGDGKDAPAMYQRKEYDKLLEYNLQDVIVTTKLFNHINSKKFVINEKGRKIKW